MDIGPREIDALLAQVPQTEQNGILIDQLMRLREASRIVKYPFTYMAVFFTAGANSNIAAGATATANVQIDAGSPFVIVSQSYYVNTANAAILDSTIPIPNVVVLITDTGSNRQMSDVAVPVNCIFGSGKFPYVLPEPKVMQANSQLSVQATNRDAAVAFNLYFAFNGYKLYRL